ncbi:MULTISPECIES: hypothetical protein [Nocardia]|uniref:hypothetical protein n=1 Tax=Nocardia TaxID=1817 RepID=UPI000D693976|nr:MULTISPECIES: hypothetical protein [Nocardia]
MTTTPGPRRADTAADPLRASDERGPAPTPDRDNSAPGGYYHEQQWQDWINATPPTRAASTESLDGDGWGAGYLQWLDALSVAAPSTRSEPSPPSETPPQRSSLSPWILGISAVVLVAVLVGGVFWLVPERAGPDSGRVPTALAPTAVTPSSAPPAPAWCADLDSPQRLRGNGAGSPGFAPQVILALEYAYYVTRSANAVRALLSPEGRFGSDAEIQAGIDAVPVGTEHCVEITPAGPDRWAAVITEKHPDAKTVIHTQTITTTTSREGRALIAAVEIA